ncbi:MAG: UbiA family prenyltransferase, partial [Thermomicrobiales bacterium]
AMLGGQLAIGATNELVDLPFDAIGKPSKPLPRGDVSVKGAKAMVAVGLLMMGAFGLPFGPVAFGLLALGTGLGLAYDLWFKRTVWSWLPYLLALPLLPIWVFTALGRPEPRLLLLYPLGALATIGVHLAQALPDVTVDRDAGLATATSQLGWGPAFVASWLTTLSAPALALAVTARNATAGGFAAVEMAAGVTLLFLVLNLALLAFDRRLGTSACFPLVALSTLANGLAWMLTVAR